MMKNPTKENKKEIQKVTKVSLIANTGLSVIKLLIGIWGNSQAVIADALHSLSDTFSDFVILFGVHYWMAPPDEHHPYGHQKIESFVTIVIGIIVILSAAGIGYNGVISLLFNEQAATPQLTWMAVAAPLLSIIIKEVLFQITYKTGVKTNASSVKANAWHHRADAVSSIPVLIAVVLSAFRPDWIFLDKIAAIIVSAFIIKLGLQFCFTSVMDLLDTGIDREGIEEIQTTILNIKNVKGVHRIRTRKLASCIYLDLHLEVDGQLSVTEGHDISEQVKTVLMAENNRIIDVLVHLEPVGSYIPPQPSGEPI